MKKLLALYMMLMTTFSFNQEKKGLYDLSFGITSNNLAMKKLMAVQSQFEKLVEDRVESVEINFPLASRFYTHQEDGEKRIYLETNCSYDLAQAIKAIWPENKNIKVIDNIEYLDTSVIIEYQGDIPSTLKKYCYIPKGLIAEEKNKHLLRYSGAKEAMLNVFNRLNKEGDLGIIEIKYVTPELIQKDSIENKLK